MKIKKIIDLTYEIKEGMISFAAPWHTKVSIKQLGKIELEGRETREIIIGSHTGTHIDAPLHFVKNGKSLDQISLKNLIGKVSIINFTYLEENERITKEMLKKIKISKKMIFKFGWGKYWGSSKFYKGYPFFSKEAAQYLVDNKVEMVAMDTPSPDDSRIKLEGKNLGSEIDSPIHKSFLRAKLVLVEYVANLDGLKDYNDWNIIVAPLKIQGADGSTARVFIYK